MAQLPEVAKFAEKVLFICEKDGYKGIQTLFRLVYALVTESVCKSVPMA